MTPTEAPEFEIPPEPPPMNEFSRLLGVFLYPGKAFADIAKRPRWWVPLLLTTIATTAYLYLFSEHVGWAYYIRAQVDQGASSMNPAQRAQILAALQRVGPLIAIVLGLTSPILSALVVAGVLKVFADTVMGAAVGFKRTLAAVTYSFLPQTILGVALAALVMMLVPPEEFNLENPVMLNAGAFVPADMPPWVHTLGASLDLFSLWTMVLISIGLAAASRKLTTGKAFGMILFPWALLQILKVGATAARG